MLPVINGISIYRVNPLIIGVITHLLSAMDLHIIPEKIKCMGDIPIKLGEIRLSYIDDVRWVVTGKQVDVVRFELSIV